MDARWCSAETFEVQNNLEFYPGGPPAGGHSQLDLAKDVRVIHLTGSHKSSWYAWHLGRGEKSVEYIRHEERDLYALKIHGTSLRRPLLNGGKSSRNSASMLGLAGALISSS